MTPLASLERVPPRPLGIPLPPMIMLWLGLHTALQSGRAERVPPRQPPSASSPDIPRKAICPWPSPRGGAGSARPQGRHRANPNLAPFWPPPYRQSVRDGDMPWFAPGPYFRTHGVRPSEKTAFAPSPGLPPQGRSSLHSPPPRRGGLCTPARKVLA